MKNTVGQILRKWRKQARYSQLQLALELDISSKHVSFIETERAKPSREMILTMCDFLRIPKGEVNRILHLAGLAPNYAELSASDQSLKPVFEAIDHIIESHMPYPAFVVNQCWDFVRTNPSASNLLKKIEFSQASNLIETLIADDPQHSSILNWHDAVASILTRLRQEISFPGSPKRLHELEQQLTEKWLTSTPTDQSSHAEQIVCATQIQVGDTALAFFSVIAQLGTVQDVTVSEYKVELLFPADEATKAYFMHPK
jgi:transcriptional regulator with XRE-family HTH domain